MMQPKAPALKHPRGLKHAPRLKMRPVRKPAAPGQAPTYQLAQTIFDIGEGPWYYDGKNASSAEYRVLLVLAELGWSPEFQVTKFGGRTLAGGQVLDILITDKNPPVYIDVRGYYHKGAAGEANDARKIMQVRASNQNVKIVIVWDTETTNREHLRGILEREVGVRGK
jgi:hypothetical protein